MNRIMFLPLMAVFFCSALTYGAYEYADITVEGIEDVMFLHNNNINIDRTSVGPGGKPVNGKITAYVSQQEFELIKKYGYSVEWSPLQIRDKSSYRYNEAIGDSMLIWQNRHPEICKRIQIGTSVQGRPLWVLKITSDVNNTRPVPTVKYVGTMHGDEVVGLELQMFMIENILKGYEAENDTMRFLVDNTEMYFMPLMNPDGMALGIRGNANNRDLNRFFPEGTFGDSDSVDSDELPEIQAMIDFTAKHNFILSTNFHGGALVANYLYDKDHDVPSGSYAACPDDEHVTWLAYNYSIRNTPMFNSTSFTDGITNGSQWYSISGGMQDWNYRYHNCLDITLEVSTTKWPSYSTIPGFWADNRESMFWYMFSAHRGIYGIVTDLSTGEPLSAEIEIEGIDKIYYTDPDHGDYYRVLKPGLYNMTVSAEGYKPVTVTGIEVTDETGVFREATEVNVFLESG